jgi:hypothetical protein
VKTKARFVRPVGLAKKFTFVGRNRTQEGRQNLQLNALPACELPHFSQIFRQARPLNKYVFRSRPILFDRA